MCVLERERERDVNVDVIVCQGEPNIRNEVLCISTLEISY